MDLLRDARRGGKEVFEDPKLLTILAIGIIIFFGVLWYAGSKVDRSAVPVKAVADHEVYRESGELFFVSFRDSAGKMHKVDSRLVGEDVAMGDSVWLFYHREPMSGRNSKGIDSVRKIRSQ